MAQIFLYDTEAGDVEAAPVGSQNPFPVKVMRREPGAMPGDYKTYNTQILTVDNTTGGVKLDSSKAATADRVTMRLSGAEISMLWDSTTTAVTTSNGMLMEISDTLVLDGTEDIKNFRAIRTGGSSGTLAAAFQRISLAPQL